MSEIEEIEKRINEVFAPKPGDPGFSGMMFGGGCGCVFGGHLELGRPIYIIHPCDNPEHKRLWHEKTKMNGKLPLGNVGGLL